MSFLEIDSSEKVVVRAQGSIGYLVLNQPEKRNAISVEMWETMGDALSSFEADAAIRSVVITGAGGKAFASGADIGQFDAIRDGASGQAEYLRRTDVHRAKVDSLSKPLIAMIQGYCLGGGLALAMRADLRIASSDSQFGIPAGRLGIAYQQVALRRLVALVGPAKAKWMLFSARRFTAGEAYRIGLIDQVVEAGDLLSTVEAFCAELGENAPLSLRAAKASIDQIAGHLPPDPEALRVLERACFDSADYIEGRRAFKEKRKPVFVGS